MERIPSSKPGLGDTLRIAATAAAAALALFAGASSGWAASWHRGDFSARFDSTISASMSIRTQGRDCNQIATINGGCNPDAVFSALPTIDELAAEGALLNTDDGNLNWDRGDVFSVLFKGTHEIQADFRNYGAFTRFTYFMDMVQIQGDSTQRTPLSREARFRGNIMESGVNGAHFVLLDAYVYGMWDVGPWNVDVRVGNVALNWGESVFTQGGINTINGLDVTKIRLPGSELKEALMPAPMVRVASSIWGPLSVEAYYQFDWKRTDLDPVGSFFASSDQVSRGAEGFFYPTGCGDPGTPNENRRQIPTCPTDVDGLTRFPNGIPKLFDDRPNDQGQFGAALRAYVDPISTELGAHFVRYHYRYPIVSFRGSTLSIADCGSAASVPDPACDLGYFIEFPEDVDMVGLSFNTLLGDWAVGGEVSYRWDQPVNVSSNPNADPSEGEFVGLEQLVLDLLASGPGGTVHGFVREKQIVAMLNGIYVAAPATPVYGPLLQAMGASESNVVIEAALVNYPSFSIENENYAARVDRADSTGFNYQIRIDMTYDRVFGSAWTLVPTVAFRHDAVGNTPSGETGMVQGLMQVGTSLEAKFQNTWSMLFSYSNSFGAGSRNGSNDRDFVGLSASYAF